MPKGGAKIAALSKYHNQQHFEPLLPEHRMGMAGGHEDGLALVEDVLHAVHGDAPLAVQTQHQRVAAGLVGADLLSLVLTFTLCNART